MKREMQSYHRSLTKCSTIENIYLLSMKTLNHPLIRREALLLIKRSGGLLKTEKVRFSNHKINSLWMKNQVFPAQALQLRELSSRNTLRNLTLKLIHLLILRNNRLVKLSSKAAVLFIKFQMEMQGSVLWAKIKTIFRKQGHLLNISLLLVAHHLFKVVSLLSRRSVEASRKIRL